VSPVQPRPYKGRQTVTSAAVLISFACPAVDEYITAGKCRRNFEGKVILSTGAFCPRDIPGTLLRERIDEWHHRNPNQLSVATLVHTISTDYIRAHLEGVSTPMFQLSPSDRIVALEAELFTLRARQPANAPAMRTRAQRARDPSPVATIEEVEDIQPERAATPEKERTSQPTRPTVAPEPAIVIVPLPEAEAEHPYRHARDAAYTPPTSKNVGAPIRAPPIVKATVPAYKTLPTIHSPSIAADVYKRLADSSPDRTFKHYHWHSVLHLHGPIRKISKKLSRLIAAYCA
jgi:hypothetical protein